MTFEVNQDNTQPGLSGRLPSDKWPQHTFNLRDDLAPGTRILVEHIHRAKHLPFCCTARRVEDDPVLFEGNEADDKVLPRLQRHHSSPPLHQRQSVLKHHSLPEDLRKCQARRSFEVYLGHYA